jgi:serine/threonine protein kinase
LFSKSELLLGNQWVGMYVNGKLVDEPIMIESQEMTDDHSTIQTEFQDINTNNSQNLNKEERDCLDVVTKMLSVNPHKRPSAEECLQHIFFKTLHNASNEPVANSSLADYLSNLEHQSRDCSLEQIKQLVWNEIREFHPDLPENPPCR